MYRYMPYYYPRRYYNFNDYYRRYHNPYFSYMQNIIQSQIANVDQDITNYGNMNDVIQTSIINQSMSGAPEEFNSNEPDSPQFTRNSR